METSILGRMEPGKCIPADRGNFGCEDDVLYLTDRWCSGRRSCEFYVLNKELMDANINCIGWLVYLRATYFCVQVTGLENGNCLPNEGRPLTNEQGVISSFLSRNIYCGTDSSPWKIEAKAGQTVEISLLDFKALSRSRSQSIATCSDTYGYIVEKTLNINHTICGQQKREHVIYRSKTNKVEIYVTSKKQANFILKYKASGCSDPEPPKHGWYKRNGNEAVIGCDSGDKEWRLTCSGTNWEGKMGTCLLPVASNVAEGQDDYLEPKSDNNSPNPTIKQEEPLIHIWETPLPDPTKPQTDQSSRTCTIHRTMQPGEKHLRTLTGGEMTSSGKPVVGSYYSPQTGHKYYVLGRDGQK
ncbi:hypothetical protein LSH36_200g02032 [Paralvinella palmiformis]|uniref:CUB domain-containing protein n=1 Tax=Paralvinella palmiformis TaxID=53620 RepID=A0AAD9JPI6_9ANNE|nr:hypothetical protein LSH36_200g02032 [Paralvinella palmiformis]